MSTTIHLAIDVAGTLRHFRAREWEGVMTDSATGRTLTPAEVKDYLLECLAKGWKLIPCDPTCEGFDHFGGGCPGHEVPEQKVEHPHWAPPFLQKGPEVSHG